MTLLPVRCEELAKPNISNFVLSILLLVGMILSYLPQHIKICLRRSSEGLSPYYILLGTTSGTCAIANILVLPTSRQDMDCCRVISPMACTAGLLGIAQIGMQWACFFLITLLFLAFTPRPGTTTTTTTHTSHDPPHQPPSLRTAITVVTLSIAHFLLTFLISIIFLARYPSHLSTWANTLGLLCTVLASTQYLPQIYTTYQLKHIGSLSIGTMLIQTPGAFILATSLAVRLGKQGWSAWLVYVVTGTLQGCLLVMAVVFERRERRGEGKGMATGVYDDEDDEDELARGPSHLSGANARFGRIARPAEPEDENTPLLQERQRQYDGQPDPASPSPSPHTPEDFISSSTGTASTPIVVQGRTGAGTGHDAAEEAEAAVDPGTGRRSSKWRWQKGDFSYKVW